MFRPVLCAALFLAVAGFYLTAGMTMSSLPALGAPVCSQATQSPYVSLEVNPGRINYITTHNRSGLKRLHRGYGTLGGNWTPIGLTLAELGMGLSVSVRSEKMADGRFCSEIAAVEATIGYDAIDVYIASEYPRGSCQYNAILDHERLHVIVFQDTLDRYYAHVERALRQAAGKAKPILNRDPNRATRKFQAILERAAKPLFKKINKEMDRGNAALDTREAYEREQSNCVSW